MNYFGGIVLIQNFSIGSFTISSYNTMFYIGCVFFVILLCAHRKVYDFAFWKALIMAFVSIPLGYGATSLLFGFEKGLADFTGFSWYGAVFFMPLFILFLYPLLESFLKIKAADYIHNLAAPLALMNGFMKIGCTIFGCCYGIDCSWGIYNTYANTKVFPIQLVEVIWNFAVCAFILWYERKPANKNKVYPVYMIVYSVGRLFCEIGRSGAEVSFKPLFGVITGGMLYALAAIGIGVAWLYIGKKREEMRLIKNTPKKAGKAGWRH